MAWRDLFVVKRKQKKGAAVPAGTADGVGSFITPQTLTSFAGASAVAGVITRVVTALFNVGESLWVPATVAFIIGVLVFLINITDQDARPKNSRAWAIAIFVGLINAIYLVAVAIGVFEAIGGVEGVAVQ